MDPVLFHQRGLTHNSTRLDSTLFIPTMATPIVGGQSAAPETKADLLNVEWRFQEWLMVMQGFSELF